MAKRTRCPVAARRMYVSISSEGIAGGETAILNIAALSVGREVTGEETASCVILRVDPGNPEVAEEEGKRNESPTRQPRSRRILGEDRTDPITANHYYEGCNVRCYRQVLQNISGEYCCLGLF